MKITLGSLKRLITEAATTRTIELDIVDDGDIDVRKMSKKDIDSVVKKEAAKYGVTASVVKPKSFDGKHPVYAFTGTEDQLRDYLMVYTGGDVHETEYFLSLEKEPYDESVEIPQDGDYFVSVEEKNKIYIDDITAGGDLSKATDADLMGDYDFDDDGHMKGPQPGEPGVWVETYSGMSYNLRPGELVRLPEYDQGGKAWAHRDDVAKIKSVEKANEPKSALDKAMLRLLSNVTTYQIGMQNVQDYRIRLRTKSIFFAYNNEMEGTITYTDTKGKIRGGLPTVYQWMIDHGAKKKKNEKKLPPMMPYYD